MILYELRKRVAGGINGRPDEKDPEWVNLYEEFRRILKKHMIYEQEGLTMENIKETQTEYQNLFDAFEDYNKPNATMSYEFQWRLNGNHLLSMLPTQP